jgi:hypothetical protein
VVLDFMKDSACWWNTNSEHYGSKRVREIAARETVRLNITELTIEGVQMKVTTVRTGSAAQLANAIKSVQSDAGLGDMYVPKLFCFKQAHSYLGDVSISRTSELKKGYFFQFFYIH